MGYTNHTPNYNLPQYIGSDKPSWLVDINGAMSDIDTGIHAAKTQATTAENKANNVTTAFNSTIRYIARETVSVTADGVKTRSQLLDELHAALAAKIATLGANERVAIEKISPDSGSVNFCNATNITGSLLKNDSVLPDFEGLGYYATDIIMISCKPSGSSIRQYDTSTSAYLDSSSVVPAINRQAVVIVEKYEV